MYVCYERLVPELVQSEVTPEHIAQATQHWLNQPQQTEQVLKKFNQLHQQLQANGSATAALAISQLIER